MSKILVNNFDINNNKIMNTARYIKQELHITQTKSKMNKINHQIEKNKIK